MTEETGWLIEKTSPDERTGIHLAIGVSSGGCFQWVTFHSALRFARKRDAEEAARAICPTGGRHTYKVTEHSWG